MSLVLTGIAAGLSLLGKGVKSAAANKNIEEFQFQRNLDQQKQYLSQAQSGGGTVTGINPYAGVNGAMAFGGPITRNISKGDPSSAVKTVEAGGTHERSPLGGVLAGFGDTGLNTVEQGEAMVDINGNKFVFSNRIPFSNGGLFPRFIKGNTYAEAAESIEKAFKDRYDKYTTDTKKQFLERLAVRQEMIKEIVKQNLTGNAQIGAPDEVQNQMAFGGIFDSVGGWFKNLFGNNKGADLPDIVDQGLSDTTSSTVPDINAESGLYGNTLNGGTSTDYSFNGVTGNNTDVTVPGYTTDDVDLALNNYNAGNPQEEKLPFFQRLGNWAEENKQGINAGLTAAGLAAQTAGVFSNIAALNKYKDTPKIVASRSDTSSVRPNLVNRQNIIREVENIRQSAVQNVAERSGGDFSQYAANVANITNASMRNVAGAMLQAEVADAQEKARAQQAPLRAEQYNAYFQTRADMMNAQFDQADQAQMAAYRQGIAQNIGSLGQSALNYVTGTSLAEYQGLAEMLAAMGVMPATGKAANK